MRWNDDGKLTLLGVRTTEILLYMYPVPFYRKECLVSRRFLREFPTPTFSTLRQRHIRLVYPVRRLSLKKTFRSSMNELVHRIVFKVVESQEKTIEYMVPHLSRIRH